MTDATIEEIEGIGPVNGEELRAASTRWTSTDAVVKDWIEQARSLPPKIEY